MLYNKGIAFYYRVLKHGFKYLNFYYDVDVEAYFNTVYYVYAT